MVGMHGWRGLWIVARGVAAAVALSALLAGQALAWQIDDPIHNACHERISHEALLQAGYVEPPRAPTGVDAQLHGGLQFDASAYDNNVYALSLVLGVRWPDLHGAPDFDFDDLAHVHNARGGQGEHCLRDELQEGVAGDLAALRDCRATIEALYWQALLTLDAAGGVAPDHRVLATTNVPYMGRVELQLSGYYWHAGRALHAIQDSFTHTFRTPDQRKVLHVFNWSEQVRCTLEEGRDGHGHESVLDDCENDNPTTKPRYDAAVQASKEFLAMLNKKGGKAERMARIQAFLDDWFTYQPGCDASNAYCDHPTKAFLATSPDSSAATGMCEGCQACPRALEGGRGPVALVVAALCLLGLRLRRRGLAGLLLAASLGLLSAPSSAWAADTGLHAEVRASFSVQNPAYAVQASAGWAFQRFEVGLLAELNPWMSVERRAMSMGTTNLGAYALVRHRLRPDLAWRAGLAYGVSILNEDMIGTDAGTSGHYIGVRLLGLEWRFADDLTLTVDGFDLAVAAPQMTGWPIVYAQQRFSIGMRY